MSPNVRIYSSGYLTNSITNGSTPLQYERQNNEDVALGLAVWPAKQNHEGRIGERRDQAQVYINDCMNYTVYVEGIPFLPSSTAACM